jgi:hypothetical protein
MHVSVAVFSARGLWPRPSAQAASDQAGYLPFAKSVPIGYVESYL